METLNFRYESIGNFCRLIVTIQIEKLRTKRDIYTYHQRFRKEPDSIFEKFLEKLYPSGCTIGENEINKLVNYVIDFMQKDEQAKDIYFKYDLEHCESYVAFKPDKKVISCYTASHQQTVKGILIDYFKGFEEIDTDYLRKFIKDNFIIKSNFTDIETVLRDIDYLARCIIIYNRI